MSTDSAALRGAHYPTLDGVRGLAIAWVVLHNFSVVDDPGLAGAAGKAFFAGVNSGWAGVTLFFVLSGFLITGILLDSQGQAGYFRRFYIRRTLRIAPLYYGVLLATFVLLPLAVTPPAPVLADQPHQWWLWTYLSNWSAPFGIADHTYPHFWSLAVEEQFYLLWPLLTFHRGARTVFWCGIGLAVLAFVSRWVVLLGGGTPAMAYSFSPCRMDALALGGSAAAALRLPGLAEAVRSRRRGLFVAALLLLGACIVGFRGLPRISFPMQALGYGLLAVSFTGLVLSLACADLDGDSGRWAAAWRCAPLRVLAKYSYGMYIVHKPLNDFVAAPFMRSLGPQALQSLPANLAYYAAGLTASLALAALSYHLYEQRFLRLKSRFG